MLALARFLFIFGFIENQNNKKNYFITIDFAIPLAKQDLALLAQLDNVALKYFYQFYCNCT